METIDKIKQQISENTILLYMKGSPKLPSCGFSSQAAQALMACGEKFAYVDILQNPDIRAELPAYAQWPTFPQLWVEGELIVRRYLDAQWPSGSTPGWHERPRSRSRDCFIVGLILCKSSFHTVI